MIAYFTLDLRLAKGQGDLDYYPRGKTSPEAILVRFGGIVAMLYNVGSPPENVYKIWKGMMQNESEIDSSHWQYDGW